MAGCRVCPTGFQGCRNCPTAAKIYGKVQIIPTPVRKVADSESHTLWIHFTDKGIPSRKYLVLPRDVRGVEKYWEDQGLSCYSEYAGPVKVVKSKTYGPEKLTGAELAAKIMGE